MFDFATRANAVAVAAWEISTGNGRDLDRELWSDHSVNCEDAAANTYVGGITDEDWLAATLRRLGYMED